MWLVGHICGQSICEDSALNQWIHFSKLLFVLCKTAPSDVWHAYLTLISQCISPSLFYILALLIYVWLYEHSLCMLTHIIHIYSIALVVLSVELPGHSLILTQKSNRRMVYFDKKKKKRLGKKMTINVWAQLVCVCVYVSQNDSL